MPDSELRTVSASQVSTLVGVDNYRDTRWMLAQRLLGKLPPSRPDERMLWGNEMQPLLLKAARSSLNLEVIPNERNTYIRRGSLGCTRDADVIAPDIGPGALETKCCFDFQQLRETWNGGADPPRNVEIQLQTQMLVGDGERPFKWGVIAMWCAAKMYYFRRDPIPELWVELEQQARTFLDEIAAGNVGHPIGTEAEHPLINRLFPTKPGKVLDLRDHPRARHFAQQVVQWQWHQQERRGHTKGEDSIKAELRAVIGDAEETLLPGGIKIKCRTTSRQEYTVAAQPIVTTMTPIVPLNASINGDDPANMWGA